MSVHTMNFQQINYFGFFVLGLLIVAFFAKSLSIVKDGVEMPVAGDNAPSSALIDETGELKYAFEECTKDSDCAPAGCSMEVCSSDPKIVTTCEVKPDKPLAEIYNCGCYSGLCAWIQK